MNKSLLLFASIIILLLSGCSSVKISLQGEAWNDKETFPVKGRGIAFIKEKISFGNYATSYVKRSWTRGGNSKYGIGTGMPGTPEYANIISVGYIDKKQTLRFGLTDGTSNQSDVFAVANFNAREFQIGKNENSLLNIALDIFQQAKKPSTSMYYVQLYMNKEESPWQLIHDNYTSQQPAKNYIGYLTKSKNHYYQIVPISSVENNKGKIMNMPFGANGFAFLTKEGQPLVAVSLLDRGTVYFAKDILPDEKFLLANAATALLMQQELGG
ncbi:MAG: hypothetical protein B7Y37_05970 [Sphingobacteriia bacterium 28-36-52]|nr:MAG: hypothetical protein B7Y37_05970 [Sphingobacteriia bacterium 28-36-52]